LEIVDSDFVCDTVEMDRMECVCCDCVGGNHFFQVSALLWVENSARPVSCRCLFTKLKGGHHPDIMGLFSAALASHGDESAGIS